jgi:glycosyltransferase involved in cell wall biosynthesis
MSNKITYIPESGPEIFAARLKSYAHIPNNVFICNPSLKQIAELKQRHVSFIVGRLDGTSYYEFSGPNFVGLLRQRREDLLPYFSWLDLLRFSFRPVAKLLNRYLDRGSLWILKNADALVFQSRLSRLMHERFLGYRPGRIPETVIMNGVCVEEFSPRENVALDGSPAVIISASLYRLHKRLQDAIRLVNSLAKRYPRIRLHVLGEFDPLVQEVLRDLDTSRCNFHGKIALSVLPEIYAGADIQLSLSTFDPCPNVVCEGLACGLPVITPLESGAAELVGQEHRSWVVEEDLKLDYYPLHIPGAIPQIPLEKYADCFNTIWENLKTEKIKARAHAEANLDIRRVARKYETYIRNCMG